MIALTCLAPARAGADVHLAFGTTWQPLRYTASAYPSTGKSSIAIGGASGFQATSLDPYFAVFFAQKFGLKLSLDIGYGKLSQDVQAGMNPIVTDSSSYFQFGFALGFKFYITQPRREKVSPYLYADFYKYFASISADKATTDQVAFAASLLSPIGATFAFGAEYFVTPNFSIGSEVLGLKIASVGADQTTGTAPPTRTSLNYTYVTFYTGISLNYRFQVQASVQSTEEEEANDEVPVAPRKKKKIRPAPATDEDGGSAPTPPPPSPEAVD